MKKCLYLHKSTVSRWFVLISFLIMGLLLKLIALFAIYAPVSKLLDFLMCVLLFFIGLALCVFGIVFLVIQSRSYLVSANGITICYLNRFQKIFRWDEVSAISVCDINYAAKDSSVYDVAIRIVIGTEKYGPNGETSFTLAGYDRWRSFGYNFIHFQNIIILDYSQERLCEIVAASGMDIHDFQSSRMSICDRIMVKNRGSVDSQNST